MRQQEKFVDADNFHRPGMRLEIIMRTSPTNDYENQKSVEDNGRTTDERYWPEEESVVHFILELQRTPFGHQTIY